MRVTMLNRTPAWLSAGSAARRHPALPVLIVVSVPLALFGEPAVAGLVVAVVAAKAAVIRILRARAEPAPSAGGTPLIRWSDRLVRRVALAVLALAAAMVFAGLLGGEPAPFMAAAGAAVVAGAIPYELPAAVTATLATGATRMARRRVTVRHLSAVETVGGATVICTNKAGTLTENQVTVTAVVADGRTYETTGAGYGPDGEIGAGGVAVSLGENAALDECLEAGFACNDSRLVEEGGRWRVSGDPTEGALLVSATKMGLEKALPRVDTLPFATDRRFMATLHRLRDEPGVIYVKGSVERVLYLCHTQLDGHGRVRALDADGIQAAALSFGRRGLRVVAFAYAHVPPHVDRLTERALPPLIYLGMQAMYDPARPQAADAVRVCQDAGILVKMTTGDDARTARATAAWVGLDGDALLTGAELRVCPPGDLPEAVARAAVLARTTREEKTLVVQALQSRHHVVAMTGKSDDDLPALRQADIGVDVRPPGSGFGDGGLEDTRPIWRSADLALADGDFASLVAAVEEGRRVLVNVARYMEWALPATLAPGLVLATGSLGRALTGTAVPIEPVQVLWLSLVTVLLLKLALTPALAADPAADDVMRRPPPAPPRLEWQRAARILVVLLVLVGAAYGLFHWELAHGATLAAAHTAAVEALALLLLAYLIGCRSLDRGLVAIGAVTLLALQLAFAYVPALHELLGSAPLDGVAWLAVAAVTAVGVCLIEAARRVLVTGPVTRPVTGPITGPISRRR